MNALLPLLLTLPAPAELVSSTVQAQGRPHLALRDVDADGDLDLVQVAQGAARVFVHPLGEDGRYAPTPLVLELPPGDLAWDLADLDGDGGVELVALVNGREVRRFHLDRLASSELLFETRVSLPRGRRAVDFARDLNQDGRADLVLPSPGLLSVRLGEAGQDGQPAFGTPYVIEYESEVDTRVGDPERVGARVGQSVRLPWVRIEDIDGDGHLDLVSTLEDRAHVYLALDGVLASSPSWILDVAALEAELPELDGIQFGDLLTHVARGVDWDVADLDGVAPHELVLRVGSTIRIYRGGSRSGPTRELSQALRVSGNVLFFFLRDADGDGRTDMQVLRGEGLSLSTILQWLVLPGGFEFQLFTYGAADDGSREVFSRQPSMRQTIQLEIPRLVSMIGKGDAFGEEIGQHYRIQAKRLRHADGSVDVADLAGGELRIFRAPPLSGVPEFPRDGAPDAWVEAILLRELDRQGDGGSLSFDLGDTETFRFSEGGYLREACAGIEPSAVVTLEPALRDGESNPRLAACDLSGNGREDLIVRRRYEDERWLEFLVWR